MLLGIIDVKILESVTKYHIKNCSASGLGISQLKIRR